MSKRLASWFQSLLNHRKPHTAKKLRSRSLRALLAGLFLLPATTSFAQPPLPPPGGSGGSGGTGGGTGSSILGNSGLNSAAPTQHECPDRGDGITTPDCICLSVPPLTGGGEGPGGDNPCKKTCDSGLGVTDGPTGGIPGTGGGLTQGGCSTCSSPASSGSGNYAKGAPLSMQRFFAPFNRVNYSSFSPGYYSQYDSQLLIYPETNGVRIAYFDVKALRVFHLVDGLDNDPQNGVFKDVRNNHVKQLILRDSSGNQTSNLTQAATAELTRWGGDIERFGIIDLDPTSSVFQAGRLIQSVDHNGYGLTINYKTWTTAQFEESPDRLWQIDTVSDSYGQSMTFTYNSAQQSGRWAVSQVSMPDNQTLTYAYTDGKLSGITYPGGTQTSISYGQDTVAQTATVSITDMAQGGVFKKYHLTNDYMVLNQGQQQQVINQPSGVFRMVRNAAEETEWMVIPSQDPNVDAKFFFTGGNRAYVYYGNGTGKEYDSWEASTVYITSMSLFPGIDGVLSNITAGVQGGATTTQLYNGQYPSLTDANNRTQTFQYSSDGFVSKRTYSADNTYEDFAHNSLGQVTRERSRTGEVTITEYDAVGRIAKIKKGMVEQGGSDVPGAGYGETTFEYYPTGNAHAGLLKAKMDPLYNSATPTLHRTDYIYDTAGRLSQIQESADAAGGARPTTTFAYNAKGLVSDVTDPLGRQTTYVYDSASRLVSTIHPDGSTDQVLYAASGADTGRVTKTKNRVNVVTSYGYDASGRVGTVTTASAIDSNILDGQADDQPITDTNLQGNTTFTYLAGDDTKIATVTDGAKSELVYDFRNQVVEAKAFPSAGKTLTSKSFYVNHEKLYDEDPYGRRKYYGYRASDGTLIRTITCTTPTQTFADFAAVWNATRSQTPNAAYIIHDAIRDDDGHLTQIIDGRGTETRYAYDDQGREVEKLEAYGTSLEAKTVTIYDSVGNVVEVRTPRYFDSTDTEGYQKARETWTYTGRNLVLTHTEAPSTSVAATESFTYDLAGDQLTHTDFRGFVWSTIRNSCCGKSVASKDPLGHGSLSNSDSAGRAVHTSTLADINDHLANYSNPIDAKTLREQTTRYDARGRSIATTTWLTPRGIVDVTAPPIAGLDGVSSADGFTTRYLYDEDLTDGVGLDSSTGVSVAKVGTGGTGSFDVSLAAAITKLASTTAQGGAGLTFNATAKGKASVVINAEDEIQFSISDAAGRTVMSGMLNNYRGSGSTALNTLASWSCSVQDATTNFSGFGNVLVSTSVDALGNSSSSWSDGAGRTLRSIDALGKVTTFTYDNAGNQLSVRDPNSVGQDVVYDALGRAGLTTDTLSHTSNSGYDRAGNRITSTDGKSQNTTYVFDARGRQKSQTDRLSGVTQYTYLATGQMATMTDAQNQTTTYTYDDRGARLTEQFPDHTGGSPGNSNYGIVTFIMDAAGRVARKQDQQGDTCTFKYDLAGRMYQRDYRTAANSPTGTIADSDVFTFDKSSRMLTAISGRYSNTVTYVFDPVGRKASESLTIAGQTYTTGLGYSQRGELSKYTYPDGAVVDRLYTARGELYQVKHNTTVMDTRAYDDGGRLASSTLGNGVVETRGYNSDNTLSTISFGGSGTAIGNLTYTWDSNKNKTSETIGGVMSPYSFTQAGTTYDAEDRLTGFARAATSGTPQLSQSWNLSAVGDWNSVTTNGTAQSRTHGPTHELVTAGGQSVTHDTKGNMLLIPASVRANSSPLVLTWDFDNRMVSADVGADSVIDVTHQYDALGRRVARTASGSTTVFVQVDQQTICDYASGAAPASSTFRYLYGSYIDEPIVRVTTSNSETTWYHRNQQYSIVACTDSSGAATERYAYTAYGLPTITDGSGTVRTSSAIGNRYTYTGREWDGALGLYHYRARMYEATVGRFCSRDPIGYEGSLLNIYEYTSENPLCRLDPTGKSWWKWLCGNPKYSDLPAPPDFVTKMCAKTCDEISRIPAQHAACVEFCRFFRKKGCDKLWTHCWLPKNKQFTEQCLGVWNTFCNGK